MVSNNFLYGYSNYNTWSLSKQKQMLKMRETVIPIVVSALGMNCKGLEERL